MVAEAAGSASCIVNRKAKSLTVGSTMAESISLLGTGVRLARLFMKRKTAAWAVVGAVAMLLALFEVRFNFQFSLPGEKSVTDSGQEARYAACYAARDKEIHKVAFGTIDNPDVQKLHISTNRKLAASECRQLFPEQMTTIEQKFRFNLVDLHFRFQRQD